MHNIILLKTFTQILDLLLFSGSADNTAINNTATNLTTSPTTRHSTASTGNKVFYHTV